MSDDPGGERWERVFSLDSTREEFDNAVAKHAREAFEMAAREFGSRLLEWFPDEGERLEALRRIEPFIHSRTYEQFTRARAALLAAHDGVEH